MSLDDPRHPVFFDALTKAQGDHEGFLFIEVKTSPHHAGHSSVTGDIARIREEIHSADLWIIKKQPNVFQTHNRGRCINDRSRSSGISIGVGRVVEDRSGREGNKKLRVSTILV